MAGSIAPTGGAVAGRGVVAGGKVLGGGFVFTGGGGGGSVPPEWQHLQPDCARAAKPTTKAMQHERMSNLLSVWSDKTATAAAFCQSRRCTDDARSRQTSIYCIKFTWFLQAICRF